MVVPFLRQLCTDALAQKIYNAESSNQEYLLNLATALPVSSRDDLFSKLELNLDLEISGVWISDEKYWKRRYLNSWDPCIIAKHGNSWKQAYFEKTLSRRLETFNATTDSMSELRRFLAFSRKYIHTLRVSELPSHIDLETVFDCLGNGPSTMTLKYGPSAVGMDYERTLFGMKLSDSRSLARVLERTEVLTSLDVSNNLIDDDKVRSLCSGLLDNISLTSLNLSKNRISDRGARAIAKVLERTEALMDCDLSDNFIYLDGARAIARALKNNKNLLTLSLRLNRMEDEGCRSVLEAAIAHPTLRHINISANNAKQSAAHALCWLLRTNNILKELDVCSNNFSGSEDIIYEALQENGELISFNILSCNMREDCYLAIEDLVTERKESKDVKKLIDACT